jgi:DNA polymerase-3 subunit delta'
LSKGNLSVAQHLMHEEDTAYTDNMRKWLQDCYSRNLSALNEWVAKTSATGREKIKQFLENSLYVFGECLHCRLIPNHIPRVPEANAKFVTDISKILSEGKIERIYKLINDTIYHIERNANPKISLFNLSLNLRNILLEAA